MLFTYDKTQKTLTPCPETQFRDHGLLERQDLSKWIELYPSILGEELLIVTTEYDKFDRTAERLDLLAVDKDGNVVVIELKRDDSGKYVDLQALKYAAYCSTLTLAKVAQMYVDFQRTKGNSLSREAATQEILDFVENDEFEEFSDRPRIILAAREYRPEVTAAVIWLRKFGIDVSCVKLDVYEVTTNEIAVNSSVLIPLPEAKDYVIQAEEKEAAEETTSLTRTEYIRFYAKCVSKLGLRLPGKYSAPTGRSYYQIPSRASGIHFEWGFHGRPRSSLGVELHFERADKKQNAVALGRLEPFLAALEVALQEKLVIQHDWGTRWSRILVEKQQGKIDDPLAEWAVEKMSVMIANLLPHMEGIRGS